MTDDWRVENAQHLSGSVMVLRTWTEQVPGWDHSHCVACDGKISDNGSDDREGYTTGEIAPGQRDLQWVCAECFHELADALHWVERQ